VYPFIVHSVEFEIESNTFVHPYKYYENEKIFCKFRKELMLSLTVCSNCLGKNLGHLLFKYVLLVFLER
jgi:hypothetical protein